MEYYRQVRGTKKGNELLVLETIILAYFICSYIISILLFPSGFKNQRAILACIKSLFLFIPIIPIQII